MLFYIVKCNSEAFFNVSSSTFSWHINWVRNGEIRKLCIVVLMFWSFKFNRVIPEEDKRRRWREEDEEEDRNDDWESLEKAEEN